MRGSDVQQVAYAMTLLHESAHEWYIRYKRRHRHPSRDWAQLFVAGVFWIKYPFARSAIHVDVHLPGQRLVHDYASQFKTLLCRLDSYDENMMFSQFIWGLQLELARYVSLQYLKSIMQAVSLAKTTELAVKAS